MIFLLVKLQLMINLSNIIDNSLMYALKLTTLAETQISCGMSEDGQILVTYSHQQNENYGFYVSDFYLRVYVIGEKQIHSQRFQISSGQHSYPSICHVRHKESEPIKIYLLYINTATQSNTSNATIIQLNEQLTDKQPKITHQSFNQRILGQYLDTQGDEIYLLFKNHILGLQGSQKIVHNEDIQIDQHVYGMLPLFVGDNSGFQYFTFLQEEKQKLNAVRVDKYGHVDKKFILDLPKNMPENYSLIYYNFKVSADHGMISVNAYDQSNYENPHKTTIFIDSAFNTLELDKGGYGLLKFGDKENHLLVYRESYSCPQSYCLQICYWRYNIQLEKLKIEEEIGCYSKDVSSIYPTMELETPENDHYFVFGNLIVNEKRKDGDAQVINDMTLFFPNDAYYPQFNQMNGYNPLYTSHGHFIQIQYGTQSFHSRVAIERLQQALHPGIIAGFVLAGILVLGLLIGLTIYFCRSKKRIDSVIASEQFKKSMQSNSENSLNNDGRPNQKPMNILVQMKKLAQKCSNQQKCCICLTIGCDTYLPCLHFYHEKCIVDWFTRNDSCPLCQQKGQISDLIKFKQ